MKVYFFTENKPTKTSLPNESLNVMYGKCIAKLQLKSKVVDETPLDVFPR